MTFFQPARYQGLQNKSDLQDFPARQTPADERLVDATTTDELSERTRVELSLH
jgi:hypothetical protein